MKDYNQGQFSNLSMDHLNDLKVYQKAILNILDHVSLETNDENLKRDLKSVYQLLNRLNQNQFLNPKSK